MQRLDLLELVLLQLLDQLLRKRFHVAGDAERAVLHEAPGAAGDLGQFGRDQFSVLAAVELARAGESDMLNVEVEPHADGVGGDQIVDIAVLVHGDLGISRARAERAEHDGGASSLAAHEFGDFVDFGRRKRDHGAAARQT